MATLDLGTFTDNNYSSGQTTKLVVPDGEPLPALPESVVEQLANGFVGFGDPYGLDDHRWVSVRLSRDVVMYESLLFFFVEQRGEWVCAICSSFRSEYGHYYGDHNLSEPYAVTPQLMAYVLQAYEVEADAFASLDLVRCHPNLFAKNG